MLTIGNKQVVDGLLGKLPSENEGDFLASCFSSDENTEKFEIIRESLIENYLVGRLSPEDKMRFDNHFLLNPHHRDLFEFAKTVRSNLHTDSELAKIINTSQVKKTFSVSNLLLPVGSLAAILIGAVLVWQFVFNNPKEQIVQVPETPANTNSKSIFPSSESDSNSNKPVGVENNIVAFTLPTIARGWKNTELKITKSTKEINLKTTKPLTEFASYQIKLEKGNKVLWQKDIDSLSADEISQITIAIPANKFENGEHRFIISGKNASGKFAEIKDSERLFYVSK